MNRDDALEILTQIGACWPSWSRDATDDSVAQWTSDLISLDYEFAHRAVRRLHDTSQWAPTWAQFREVYFGLKHAAPEPPRAPVEDVTPREVTVERFARMRQVIGSLSSERRPAGDRGKRAVEIAKWIYDGGNPPAGLKEK